MRPTLNNPRTPYAGQLSSPVLTVVCSMLNEHLDKQKEQLVREAGTALRQQEQTLEQLSSSAVPPLLGAHQAQPDHFFGLCSPPEATAKPEALESDARMEPPRDDGPGAVYQRQYS